MYKNYLKVALRNLWKNKAFSIINIAGLAALITISLQTIRAAIANPVESLHAE